MIPSNRELIDKNYITNRYYTLNDPEFISVMAEAPWSDFAYRLKEEDDIVPEYKEKFLNRLKSTKLNKITGLDRFKCQDIIHGVTQSFDEIFYRHHKRRLRIFRGEYTYHRRSFPNWEYID
ncbi:MAG: hypothetical protein OXN83_02980, partial [Oligoflexia bacterium]|nr:hypothetical protein [Oligoflexia bacterium]